MQNIHPSPTRKTNPDFPRRLRKRGEDNLKWLQAGLGSQRGTAVVLIGGKDNLAFRLRAAQAHVRDSFTPSHWSHCFLLFGIERSVAATPIYEIALDPPNGFGFPGSTNGMQEGTLGRYASAERYPNIAVVQIPVDVAKAADILRRFPQQRAILDAVDLMVRWLAYGWGAGDAGNPLFEGFGIPSAAMIELVCNAAGYDITPNTPSRASTPESLWQATKWWWEFPRVGKEHPTGSFVIGDAMGDQSQSRWERRLKSYARTR